MGYRFDTGRQCRREIARGGVHIWVAALDRPTAEFIGWLSPVEMRNAERFHFKMDRRRYIVRHGILRKIISGYLGIEPGRVRFSYGMNNKPSVANRTGEDKLCFNLSHAGGLALYAFIWNREIGIDIERVRDIPEMDQIARNYLSPGENEVFQRISESSKQQAFFHCWTRKEAFIKAIGEGLAYPLNGFEVSLAPGEPARLINIGGDLAAAAPWSIFDLKTAPGFTAALAVLGRAAKIDCWEWAE